MAEKKERSQPTIDFQAFPISEIEWEVPGRTFSKPNSIHAQRWNEFIALGYKPEVHFQTIRVFVVWSK